LSVFIMIDQEHLNM